MEIPVYALLFLFLAPTALALVLAHNIKTIRTVDQRQQELEAAIGALRARTIYRVEEETLALAGRLRALEVELETLRGMFLRQSERLAALRPPPPSHHIMLPAGKQGRPETLVQPVPATAYERLLDD